jgi:O-antigen/teichoic acid export membrane protein
MGSRHYAAKRASKSLLHFLVGKGASALTGIACLILIVRYMAADHYGGYVALIAVLDLFYLSTGLGLSTIAQRYVPEFRMRASMRRLQQFLTGLLLKRLALSLAFTLALLAGHRWLAPLLGVTLDDALLPWIATLLVASASVFFLEEVLGALLLQGVLQALAFLRSVLKLAAILYLVEATGKLEIEWVLMLECGVALLSLGLGHALLYLRLRSSQSEPGASDTFTSPAMQATAQKFYLVQLVGQSYGPQVSKLVVTKLLGLGQTAVLGFAQSIADMLRHYLPAHLLAGWIRPLMVSRYVARRNMADLTDIANLVLKLNLLGIVPIAVFFILRGDAFATWVTGGRYPHAGTLLVLLTLMVGLQTVHLIFSMITITLEQPGANLKATLVAAAGLPLSALLIYWFGIEGSAWGLLATELLWLVTAAQLMTRRGFRITWDLYGSARIVVAGCVAAAALMLAGFGDALPLHLACSAAIVGVVFLGCSMILKPLRAPERALARGIVPARLIIW